MSLLTAPEAESKCLKPCREACAIALLIEMRQTEQRIWGPSALPGVGSIVSKPSGHLRSTRQLVDTIKEECQMGLAIGVEQEELEKGVGVVEEFSTACYGSKQGISS